MIVQYPMDEYAKKLCKGIAKYDYPPVTYDFEPGVHTCTDSNRRMLHPSMFEVEGIIKSQLLSDDFEKVKDGLSNVLYWGFDSFDFRDHRVETFRGSVSIYELLTFSNIVKTIEGPGLVSIANIGLPQFSSMPFVSKLRMFLDPTRYPVLDKKIAEFSQSPDFPPLENLTYRKGEETTIRRTKHNERVYEKWASWCRDIAQLVNAYPDSPCKNIRAVDVERSIFHLAGDNKPCEAWSLLQGPGR